MIRNTYDASGRLTSTMDASNFSSMSYAHDIPGRRETVTDRLGNPTVYEYDDRGNVVRVTDALGNRTGSTYDDNDNLLSQTNALGFTTSYTYDAFGNRLTEKYALGQTTGFSYNERNQVVRVIDPRGNPTEHSYDARGNLSSTKDPLGAPTTFVYDTRGLLRSRTDALGKLTQFTYDGAGNVTSETDAEGTVQSYTYDGQGNRLTESVTRTTPQGSETVVTAYLYDRENRLVKTTHPDSSTTEVVYNALGQRTATVDELGRKTTFEYDNLGRLTRTVYPDGTTEQTLYDAEGRRVGSVDRRGLTTGFTYDRVGRLIETRPPGEPAEAGITRTSYDAASQVVSTTDGRGNVTRYVYDEAGRRIRVIDALAQVTEFRYDAAGNQVAVKDARENETRMEYDAAGRLTKTIHPDQTQEATGYDAVGRVISRTDAAGKTTEYGHDGLGRLVRVKDALGQETSYGYDEVGNRIVQKDALGRLTQFVYDVRARRVARALPLQQRESLVYYRAGNLIARTDFNGRTTTHTYDSMNRLVEKRPDARFGAAPVRYTYTATGKRATMEDGVGTTTYQYNQQDRLRVKSTPQGRLDYTYDAAANLTFLTFGPSRMSYTYDALNRLSAAFEFRAAGTTSYTYDAVGNLATVRYQNGVEHGYTYDRRNRLTELGVNRGTPLARYAYTLGPAGHRVSVAEPTGRTVTYQYDELFRLTGETIAGDPAGQNGGMGYRYDAVGNRLERTSTVPAIPPGLLFYDANDRLTRDVYDGNGNTISSGGEEYAYDFENRVIRKGGVTIVYDGDGHRVSKTVGGVRTDYLVDELNPTGYAQVVLESLQGVTQWYVYGLDLIAQVRPLPPFGELEVRYYGYDGNGSVRFLTDASGAVTDTYDYDAFGNLLSRTGTTPNNYLYAGEQFDPDLGLYYNRARYLDVRTGRFWTMDPFEGDPQAPASLHRYLYAVNDPVNRVDPSGAFEFTIGGLVTAMAIGATVWGTYTYVRTGHFGAAANAALTGALIGATFYVALPYAATALWRISLLAGGGAVASGGGGGTVTFYRAMSRPEFQQLMSTGRFQAGPNSIEAGKWFAEKLPHAIQWGQRLEGTNFVVLEVQVQATAAQNFIRLAMLDGIGPARFALLEHINGFILSMRGVYP